MELFLFVSVLLMLAVSAQRWGVSSVEDVDSPEWQRRREWRGFHGDL